VKTGSKIALGIVGALAAYTFLQRFNDKPRIFYVKKVPFGYNGFIIPPFGIVIDEKQKGNKNLLLHELVHWSQFRREGFLLFLLNYAYQAQKVGYDKNPYEIEARYMESEHCKNNYTECVRKGTAGTVHNPEFRT
jgi:hypothetical protein